MKKACSDDPADGRGRASRRTVLTGLAASLAAPALARPPEVSVRPAPRPSEKDIARRLAPASETLVSDATLGASASVSFAVADAETGEVLETRGPLVRQPPASVAKAVTALYALDALGPAYRYATRVHALGPVSADGRLEGDLVLAGTGDPTLQTNALAELAARLKEAGLREVTGRFLVWDGVLPRVDRIDPGQPDHVGYNPAVSGLNLNFNRVHFEWKRNGGAYAVTMDARSNKYRPDVRVARMSVVRRATPVYTYEDAGDVDVWTVASGALGAGGARWLPVREPAFYAGEVFATFARAHGIALKPAARSDAPPSGPSLAEVQSGPMADMLRDMLKYSTNITAEAVGLSASVGRGGAPLSLEDSGAQMSAWLGGAIRSQKPAFVDHSGLGDRSRLTATDMVRALVRVGPDAGLSGLLKPLPMRDRSYAIIDGYPAEVMAKTGTLNFVSALAGYVVPSSGRRLAFAIFTADVPRRAGIPRAQRERPEGSRSWARRSRVLQVRLIDRWYRLYA
ncbi:MAG: D-alanyl-D-alanine carboxypeptidase/D-alanyl-D-alanine-endopeptidase [Pseudomonadota bacterium]